MPKSISMPRSYLMHEKILLTKQGPRDLPEGLVFEGLAYPRGKEALRLRFRKDTDARVTVDLPISAMSLADLVYRLYRFRDATEDDILRVIELMHAGGELRD